MPSLAAAANSASLILVAFEEIALLNAIIK
jgi:hypothetical protein